MFTGTSSHLEPCRTCDDLLTETARPGASVCHFFRVLVSGEAVTLLSSGARAVPTEGLCVPLRVQLRAHSVSWLVAAPPWLYLGGEWASLIPGSLLSCPVAPMWVPTPSSEPLLLPSTWGVHLFTWMPSCPGGGWPGLIGGVVSSCPWLPEPALPAVWQSRFRLPGWYRSWGWAPCS